MLAAACEQQAAANRGALQQQPSEPSDELQHDIEGSVAGPHAAAALEAIEGSMAAAQPDAQQQQNTQAAAGGMSVTDLKAVLARVCTDKEAVRAHMVPVRYLAKLLHGEDIDHSTVQLATLLPQVGVLMSHMRDRVAGEVQGKQAMAPHKAAAHAAALQRVLGCAEVQAKLGQQQVLQLLAAVRAAEQEFEAAEGQVTSQEQAAPVSTEEEGQAADGTEAAGGGGMAVGSTAQQGAQRSLSVAQLLVEARTLPRSIATALRQLLVVAHGPEADAAAVQVADLLPQWPLLQAHLQQRVKGEGQELPLKRHSAWTYAHDILHCLALLSVQAQFSAAALSQLVQQVQDGKVQLSSTPDGTARATGLATTNTTAAAAAGPSADTAATAANRPRRGAAAGGMSVAQLLDALARSYNGQMVSSAETAINKLLLLVHGPGADAAAVQAADLLQQWPVLCADLQQRMTGPKPSIKAGSAHTIYVASVLRVLRMPQVAAQFECGLLQRLQRQVEADRAAYFPKARGGGAAGATGDAEFEGQGGGSDATSDSQGGSDSDADGQKRDHSRSEGVDEGVPAGGLSVAQLLDALASRYNGQTVSRTQTAINKLLLLVHGPDADAAAVRAADLLQQWPVLCADLQQRVSGPEPSIKPSTAYTVYVASVLRVLRMPQVAAQFECELLQQLQRQVKADRVAYFPWSGQGKALGGIAGRKGACDSESDGEGSDAAVSSECGSEGVIEIEAAGANDETSPPAAVGAAQQQVMTLGELKEQLASNYSARSMLNGVAKAAGFNEASRDTQPLPAVLKAQHVQGFLRALRDRGCSRAHLTNAARLLTAVVSRPRVQRSLVPDSLQQLQQALEQAASLAATTERTRGHPLFGTAKKGKPAVLQSTGQIDVGEGNACSPSQGHGQTAGPGRGEQPAVTSALDAITADSNAAGQRGAAFATAQLAAASAQAQPSAQPPAAEPPLADASVRNLLAAQQQLLALYAHKLSPSLSEKLALRSTLQMLAGLPPGDIRLDMFWTDYDWVVMLSEEAESTPEHWREAFDTLIANATSGP